VNDKNPTEDQGNKELVPWKHKQNRQSLAN
jgi:hypothetical protein